MNLNFNGKIIKNNSFINRGLYFGDGCFESILFVNNKIPLWKYHYKRLIECIKYLNFDITTNFTSDNLYNEIRKTVKANNLNEYCRVRLTVFRKSEGNYYPNNNTPFFIIETKKLTYNKNNKVCKSLGIYKENTKSITRLSNFKTLNSLLYVLASIFSHKNKFDNSLIINSKGNIIESYNSNVFIIKNNKIFTPPLNDACIDGVVRRYIMNKFNVLEKSLTEEDILESHECFLTNAVSGIIPVTKFYDKNFIPTTASASLVRIIKKEIDEIMNLNG